MTATAQTRARVNRSALEYHRGSALPSESDHEKMVAAFMAQAAVTDPRRFASTCEKNPTLSESALKDIRKREISAFSPADEAGEIDILSGGHSGARVYNSIDSLESLLATTAAAMGRPPLLP